MNRNFTQICNCYSVVKFHWVFKPHAKHNP